MLDGIDCQTPQFIKILEERPYAAQVGDTGFMLSPMMDSIIYQECLQIAQTDVRQFPIAWKYQLTRMSDAE